MYTRRYAAPCLPILSAQRVSKNRKETGANVPFHGVVNRFYTCTIITNFVSISSFYAGSHPSPSRHWLRHGCEFEFIHNQLPLPLPSHVMSFVCSTASHSISTFFHLMVRLAPMRDFFSLEIGFFYFLWNFSSFVLFVNLRRYFVDWFLINYRT